MIRVRGLLLCLACGAGLAGAMPALAQTSRPEITRIRFEGNRVFDDDDLRSAIYNRETECKQLVLQPFCWAGVEAAIDRRYLQPREVPLDALRLQAYYWLRGYREASVDTTVVRDDGTVGIEFRIDEGEPVLVDELEVFGLEEIDVPGVASNLPLSVGAPLSAIRIEAVKDTLVSRLREVGYAHAAVFSGFFIPAETRRAQVTFDVDPGPIARFGSVSVSWLPGPTGEIAPELDETSIRRMVPFREGSLYRYSQLVEGQRNLYSLEMVRTARVRTLGDTVALDTIIPVAIQIGEGDLHRVRAGAGWSTADCINTEAQWGSRNFQGGARRLTVRGRLSNILTPQLNGTPVCSQAGKDDYARLNGRLSVELVQPWVYSPRNSLTATAFMERQSLPDVFIRTALGFTVAFTRTFGRQSTATLSYQPALTKLDAGGVFFCVSFFICTEGDIDALQEAQWLSPVVLGLGLNRSNRFLNPTAGYSMAVDLEHASRFTGSHFSYNRYVGEVAGYAGLGEETVLAARLRGGLVNPGIFRTRTEEYTISHPQKRFYSGGAGSVRGFGENRLGPRVLSVRAERLVEYPAPGGDRVDPVCLPEEIQDGSCDPIAALRYFDVRPTGGDALLEANVELRFPFLAPDLQGAVFVDAGNVWPRAGNENINFDLNDLQVSPGVGIRYFSPIGPIRVDVGYRWRTVGRPYQGAEDLQVVTGALEPCAVATSECLWVRGPEGTPVELPWVVSRDLRLLDTRVPYGGGSGFLDRLQLHLSIGQAF
jgi:outer membrane protein assembly factor BamA